MRDQSQKTRVKRQAAQWGTLNYVALDGNIGCMVNSAGTAMGTMDASLNYMATELRFMT